MRCASQVVGSHWRRVQNCHRINLQCKWINKYKTSVPHKKTKKNYNKNSVSHATTVQNRTKSTIYVKLNKLIYNLCPYNISKPSSSSNSIFIQVCDSIKKKPLQNIWTVIIIFHRLLHCLMRQKLPKQFWFVASHTELVEPAVTNIFHKMHTAFSNYLIMKTRQDWASIGQLSILLLTKLMLTINKIVLRILINSTTLN